MCDILINIFGIDNTAVTKSNSLLFLIEVGVVKTLDFFGGNSLLLKKTLNHTTLEKMLFYDFGYILNLNL